MKPAANRRQFAAIVDVSLTEGRHAMLNAMDREHPYLPLPVFRADRPSHV